MGTIPSGTDLATYFADFSSTEVSPTEVAYELEAGGNYTMTGNVDFDRHWLTLRGDRNDPPTVTIIATPNSPPRRTENQVHPLRLQPVDG